jgi:hypothetical protein
MNQTTPSAPETEAHLDKLARLHRMSRTAGLGTTDYAAVNVAAVMTAVLGAASLLALFTPFFLVIPVAGLVVGIIALRQIKASGGTQTGLIIAILGLAACVAFSAFTGLKAYNAYAQTQSDKATLTTLVKSFGDKLSAEDYAGAHALLDARFQDRVPQAKFEQFFREQMQPYVGKMTGMQSNGHFFVDEAADDPSIRMAQGISLVSVEKNPGGQPLRVDLTFRHAADEWKIFDIASWFPVPQQGGPGGPG